VTGGKLIKLSNKKKQIALFLIKLSPLFYIHDYLDIFNKKYPKKFNNKIIFIIIISLYINNYFYFIWFGLVWKNLILYLI